MKSEKSTSATTMAALLATCCLPAVAADRVLLEVPILYEPNAAVVDKVREECQVEALLERHIAAVLAKRNKDGSGTLVVGTDAQGAIRLKVTINFVMGVGGGSWSGPKAISIRSQLFDGQVLKREQKIQRSSMGGFWGGFKGTCSILDRTATALGKDIGKWAFDPRYVMKDDELSAPAVAAPAASAASADDAP